MHYIFSVYHMMETGWVKVSSTDVKDLHYQYQKEKAEEKPEPGRMIDVIIIWSPLSGIYSYWKSKFVY